MKIEELEEKIRDLERKLTRGKCVWAITETKLSLFLDYQSMGFNPCAVPSRSTMRGPRMRNHRLSLFYTIIYKEKPVCDSAH